MHRSPSGASAVARVIWNDRAGGQLLVANLPLAPEGKAYELWALGAGAPRPAGVFQVGPDGRAVQTVEPGGGPASGFAVTLEPAANRAGVKVTSGLHRAPRGLTAHRMHAQNER